MSPGGITDCDDCAWSLCFKGTGCLRHRARQLGVAPQDLLDGAVVFGADFSAAADVTAVLARNPTPSELEELEAELSPGVLILTDTVVTHD